MEYSKKQIKSILKVSKEIIKNMKDTRTNFAQIIENNNNYYMTDGYKFYKFKKSNTLYNEFLKNNIKITQYEDFTSTINFENLIDNVLNDPNRINFDFTLAEIKKYMNKLKIAKNYNMIYETTNKYAIYKKINEKYIALNPKWLQDACNVLDTSVLSFTNDGSKKDCFLGLSIAKTDLATFGILPIKIGTIEAVEKMKKIQNKKIILLSKIKRNLHGKSILLKSHIKEEYRPETEETKKSKVNPENKKDVKTAQKTSKKTIKKVVSFNINDLNKIKKQIEKNQNIKNIEILGAWIWCETLDTTARDLLLNIGFKFSFSKLKFYYHNKPFKKRSNKTLSYERIKELYKKEVS